MAIKLEENEELRDAILKELEDHIKALGDIKIIEMAGLRRAVAIFPDAGKRVHNDYYFATDLRDRACEDYWREFGNRAWVPLFDWPLSQMNEEAFEDLLNDKEKVTELAEKFRREFLACNLPGLIRDALEEVSILNERDDRPYPDPEEE